MEPQEVHAEFKGLPANERGKCQFVVENDDSWIPTSSKKHERLAEPGGFVDMEPLCMKRRRPVCNEISLPRGGAVLDDLLRLPSQKGSARPNMENFSRKTLSIRDWRTHKSSGFQRLRRTFYAIEIGRRFALRLFYLDGETVVSLGLSARMTFTKGKYGWLTVPFS